MSGKGLPRLWLLLLTALVGAGVTLGAMHAKSWQGAPVEQSVGSAR